MTIFEEAVLAAKIVRQTFLDAGMSDEWIDAFVEYAGAERMKGLQLAFSETPNDVLEVLVSDLIDECDTAHLKYFMAHVLGYYYTGSSQESQEIFYALLEDFGHDITSGGEVTDKRMVMKAQEIQRRFRSGE